MCVSRPALTQFDAVGRRSYRQSMRWPRFLALALALPTAGQEPAPPPRFSESVVVERLLLDVRVLGSDGRVLRGLAADDFRVRIGRREARVESARWVGSGILHSTGDEPRSAPEPVSRLIVFLFQKDLRASRLPGLIQIKQRARLTLDRLAPEDHVALLSFDSRLRLWLDFTTDRAAVARALDESLLFGRRPPAPEDGESAGPRLREAFDATAARRADSIEAGLLVLARALEPLPGAKSVIFCGHGFGTLDGSFAAEYGPARRALRAARATVFSIDVTQADRHTMEVGLEKLAWDTGGFYARAYHFPGQALSLVEATIEGHYTLILERPAGLAAGRRGVDVDLVRARGRVLAPPTIGDP